MMKLLHLFLSAIAIFSAAGSCSPAEPAVGRAFFDAHCVDCHGKDTQKGRFRADMLGGQFDTPESALRWSRVIARLEAGEMPPKGNPRPPATETQKLLLSAKHRLANAAKAEAVMLTGAPYPDYSHNLKNTISIDQEFAARVRGQTRYNSFVLSTYYGSLSYTSNGVAIPSVNRPSEIFKQLFLATTPQQAEEELRRIDDGRSMLDVVSAQAKRLNARISKSDRSRVDEYFTSVRDVEKQLQMAREWVHRPKPAPIGNTPSDISNNALQQKKLELMFDMIHLAMVTDATRAVTIKTFGMHHDLSHHGKEPKKLADCQKVELELVRAYGGLLKKLKTAREGDQSLLDNTMVLMTSNLRDGNTHWTHDLPVLLAGGGFRHGQHLAFNQPYVQSLAPAEDESAKANQQKKTAPQMGVNQAPLCNLFTSMLQQAGVETSRFSSGSGTLTGLQT